MNINLKTLKMKNLIYIGVFLFCIGGFAQEKPKEVKEESQIKVVKTREGNRNVEKKVKVVTRETADVELDKNDAKKVNQDRIKATKKVEKMVMVDNDDDDSYDLLSKETYFVSGDENYKFSPSNQGFDIAFDNDNNKFINIGKAWSTNANGSYIIRGKMHNGIGYFDADGNFIIEYYNKDSNEIETIIYKRNNSNL